MQKSRHISAIQNLEAAADECGMEIHPRDWEAAKRKVGKTPQKRFAWVLRFGQQDPVELTAGELLDDCMRLLAFTNYNASSMSVLMPDAKSVAEVRREIADMLDPSKADQQRWCSIDFSFHMWWPEGKDKPPVVGLDDQTATARAVMIFIDSFNQYQDQMRRCEDEKCRHWFIGPPNKLFCSTTCLSRTTTERTRKGGR